MTRSGQLQAFEKQGPPAHWVEVKMNGYKSNNRGIGSVVEFKAGNYYNKVMVTSSPVRVFTGDLPSSMSSASLGRMRWCRTGSTSRPTSRLRFANPNAWRVPARSCTPGMAAKFVYVTDVLGVGPLGELAPDGTRVKPFPEELVRLPNLVARFQWQLCFPIDG